MQTLTQNTLCTIRLAARHREGHELPDARGNRDCRGPHVARPRDADGAHAAQAPFCYKYSIA